MNYFNYFTEIEEAFIQRRGKTLLLSPIDWALIESWKSRGVPLHIALNAIAQVFDAHDKNPRKRSIKGLLYCAEEVEAQYAEWLENQVGRAAAAMTANSSSNGGSSNAAKQVETNVATVVNEDEDDVINAQLPFPPEAIAHHLTSSIERLEALRAAASTTESFNEVVGRALMRLQEINANWRAAKRHTATSVEGLERALTEIENLLDVALQTRVTSDELARHRKEVAAQLAPFRLRMQTEVYQTTLANLLQKRLRETFNLPRLSLFYL